MEQYGLVVHGLHLMVSVFWELDNSIMMMVRDPKTGREVKVA